MAFRIAPAMGYWSQGDDHIDLSPLNARSKRRRSFMHFEFNNAYLDCEDELYKQEYINNNPYNSALGAINMEIFSCDASKGSEFEAFSNMLPFWQSGF